MFIATRGAQDTAALFPGQLPKTPTNSPADPVPARKMVCGGESQEPGHVVGGGDQQCPRDVAEQRWEPPRGLRRGHQERKFPRPGPDQVANSGRDPPPDGGATIGRGAVETSSHFGEHDIGMSMGQGGQVGYQITQLGHVVRDGVGVAGDQHPGALPVGQGRRQQRRGQVTATLVDDPATKTPSLRDRSGGVVGGEGRRVRGSERKQGRCPDPDASRGVFRKFLQTSRVAQHPGDLNRQQGVIAGFPHQSVEQHR